MVTLGHLLGARDLYAVNYDGTRVPMYSNTRREVVLWNALRGTGADAFTGIGGMRYCRDVPYSTWFNGDLCQTLGEEALFQQFGHAPVNISATTDKGDVVLGRAGTFFSDIAGAMWIEGLGWMTTGEFLRKQGGEPWPATPEELRQFMVRELEVTRAVVKAAGIKVEQ